MKVKNIFGNEYSGTIGNKLTASRWKGIEYLRKHAQPHNPNSPLQENVRNLFTEAVAQWRMLTPEQKAFYDRIAVGMSGYNVFVKRYIEAMRFGLPFEPPIMRELTVVDDEGYTLAEALVAVTRGNKDVFRGMTDENGVVRFAISRYDGPYDLEVSGPNYTTFRAQNLCPAAFPDTATISPAPVNIASASAC
ncbi:MAG: carboxypeptidase regulatory-like domain-containing protein [Euryarchaeota archaeon]|nr:carboxypeptidase regulatory-like domain-containing protein [Euryarchaeota archaeon]